MDLGLEGRVAIVSGGSKGIGEAIAKSLASEGVKVVVSARGKEALARLKQEIQKKGGEVITICADATDPQAVSRVDRKSVV